MTDGGRKKQARIRFRAGCFLALMAPGFLLGACGKKPGSIDPPPDVTDDHFPRVYPDPATDPKP
jgi:hypothetical protein